MTTNKNTEKNTEFSQGEGRVPPPPPPPGQTEQLPSRNGNTIFKSGPLFISSKGIGWTSWKKRWFILTRTSLVFFRSDPSAIPQKGSEVNLTLGGIDLNNSGSVDVKADKKLLTVLFPDGRDGRAFTLKAETLEDLYEWKTALENALAQAPSAALVMGQNGIFRNDQADGADDSSEKLKDEQRAKSLVIGRPILLALEDIDGSPSFLEKALRFIEEHGIKVEGILRQAAAVDDVEHRIRQYEQGKTEFSPVEDAHVIADCVKYFLRELPSSPVPASCCNALLEACRTDRGSRVNAMRVAICETFPEPNRRLLQRILLMMQTVASHKAVNRMSTSAVAACMAPLLLRPLLSGDCEIETDFDVGGDGSIQLLQAAAAANHAQAIVITLLEEYDNIFSEGSMSPGLYSDSEECGSEDEEVTDDDDESYEDDEQDDVTEESDAYTDAAFDNASSGTCTEIGDSVEDDLSDNKGCDDLRSDSKSSEVDDGFKDEKKLSSNSIKTSFLLIDDVERNKDIPDQSRNSLVTQENEYGELLGDASKETTLGNQQTGHNLPVGFQKSTTISNGPVQGSRRRTVWGRTSAKKNLSMESIEYPFEDEVEVEKLEACKIDLQNRISEEVKGNEVLQAKLEERKKALHERRLALEKDVARLQEQLLEERDKRKVLEAGLNGSQGPLLISVMIDEKTTADIEEITQAEADITNLKQKVDDLSVKLNQQCEQSNVSTLDTGNQPIDTSNNQAKVKDKQKNTHAAASSHHLGKSASKDINMDKGECENEKRYESTSLPNKRPPQIQRLDQTRGSNSKPTNSRKFGAKSEGSNSTTSALSKLTTRLNFLKERRSQIATQLQNLDKGQGSGHAATNPDKSRGSESNQSGQNPDKGLEIAGQLLQNSEKFRKSDCQSLNLDRGNFSEDHHPQVLERGKSEGHVSYSTDNAQGSGGQPPVAPRNNSR